MAAGVVRKLSDDERSFYTAKDVQRLMEVSRDKAYRMIRYMREECIAAGTLSKEYPQGRVPKKYFDKQCMIE